MPINKSFKEALAQLNDAQSEAVESIDGPVMVIAGPGTGKTQVLTLRIANILQTTDTSADSVLALTFTEAAAHNMRRRLLEIVGPTAYRVGIYTFHGFANSIIQDYPDSFPRIVGSININIVDQIQILEEIIDKTKLKKLKPFGNNFFYLRPVLSAIGKLKRDNISVKKLENRLKREGQDNDKNLEFLLLYKKYQEELEKNNYYDYDDMIVEVITALGKDKDMLLDLQEKYQFILADEHQDANLAQNELLELLSSYHESPNLFVVGDEKQAIFRFQGASLENFNYFKDKFKDVKLVSLTENYRSGQTILDSAYSLISRGEELRSNKESKGLIKLYEFSSSDHEHLFVVREVERLIAEGVDPGEIAILYRDNKDALPLIRVFEKGEVPFIIESDQDILADIDIRKLILIMRAVARAGDEEYFVQTLHTDFLNIDSTEIYKYIKTKEESKDIRDLRKKLSAWSKTSYNKNFIEFFEIVVRESGFLDYLINHEDGQIKMEKLTRLFDETKSLVEAHRGYGLPDFLDYIDLLEEHNILIKRDSKAGLQNGVHLMTAHKSKGQEFDHVFIVGATAGHWGSRRSVSHFKEVLGEDKDDDGERRLFYVALTRARDSITISYARFNSDGRNLLPSQFVSEIDPGLIESIDTSKLESELSGLGESFKPKLSKGVSVSDRDYLLGLFTDQGLSATALNNYLTCPWRYFYSNLVRIPTAISRSQMYGIAVHRAIKELFETAKEGKDMSSDLLLANFKRALDDQALSEGDYEMSKEKGEVALRGWFDTHKDNWNLNSLNEFKIKGIELGGIKLTGQLDKVEMLEDDRVNVIDYKTGKPRSRNDILGETKTSNGDYFRQLVFYKLLLDNYMNGQYQMRGGEIDFIEPNPSGKYKKEYFDISDSDVNKLRAEIERVAGEIREFSFWGTRCDDSKCQHCKLRDMMR